MTISNFVAYVKQAWKNKPDTSTPLSAARLTHLEDGIKGNSDAIEKIAAAVVSQIANDPNKIASMAALYSVNQAVTQLNSDLNDKISILSSDPNVTARFVTEKNNCSIIINHATNKIMQITFDITNERLTTSYFNGNAWSEPYVIKQW